MKKITGFVVICILTMMSVNAQSFMDKMNSKKSETTTQTKTTTRSKIPQTGTSTRVPNNSSSAFHLKLSLIHI